MRPIACLLLLAIVPLSASFPARGESAAATAPTETNWTETARDVYVDGVFQPAAWVLFTEQPDRLAVLVPGSSQAWIADVELNTVATWPADAFSAFADHSGATTTTEASTTERTAETNAEASLRRIPTTSGSIFRFVVDAGEVLIAPHMGPRGSIEREDLWHARPTWQRRHDVHQSDPALVEALRAHANPVELTVAFGTWCGDSRRGVPRLLKALDDAANPLISVRLVAIERGFTEPLDTVQGLQLTNVPTIIARSEGSELGRLVETPIGDSLEQDLVALLADQLPRHPGALTRQATLARGRYEHRDANGHVVATEDWSLHETTRERHMVHSRIVRGDDEIELFQRYHPDGATDRIEVTRRGPDRTSRSRAYADDEGTLSVTTRGSDTGIVRQDAMMADGELLGPMPCTAVAGRPWQRAGRPLAPRTVRGYRIDDSGAAHEETLSLEPLGLPTETKTPAGMRLALRQRQVGIGTLMLDTEFGFPLAGTTDDGLEIVLTALEITPDPQ